MKKTYINPAMKIVKIKTQMLAASLPTGSTPTNPGSSDSRGIDFSDDDFGFSGFDF